MGRGPAIPWSVAMNSMECQVGITASPELGEEGSPKADARISIASVTVPMFVLSEPERFHYTRSESSVYVGIVKRQLKRTDTRLGGQCTDAVAADHAIASSSSISLMLGTYAAEPSSAHRKAGCHTKGMTPPNPSV